MVRFQDLFVQFLSIRSTQKEQAEVWDAGKGMDIYARMDWFFLSETGKGNHYFPIGIPISPFTSSVWGRHKGSPGFKEGDVGTP